ncbi:MAG: hypothetical protein OCD02_05445 [Spirochaetaceae bacterium]
MIKKILILLSILTITLFEVFPSESFLDKTSPIVDKWLSSNITDLDFISEIENLEKNIDFDDNSGKSISKLYIGLGYFQAGNKKLSLKALAKGQEYSELALNKKQTSENWRVNAEIGSYIMLQKGVTYIIKNSGKVNKSAQNALDLNPRNARAALIVAQGLINAPALFGGDIKEGIKTLEELTKRNDINKEDLFFIYNSLSDAYEKNKKKDKSIESIKKVLKLFPQNQNLTKKLRSLER